MEQCHQRGSWAWFYLRDGWIFCSSWTSKSCQHGLICFFPTFTLKMNDTQNWESVHMNVSVLLVTLHLQSTSLHPPTPNTLSVSRSEQSLQTTSITALPHYLSCAAVCWKLLQSSGDGGCRNELSHKYMMEDNKTVCMSVCVCASVCVRGLMNFINIEITLFTQTLQVTSLINDCSYLKGLWLTNVQCCC